MKEFIKKKILKKNQGKHKKFFPVTGNGFVSLVHRRLVDPTAATRCGETRRDKIR